MTIASWSQVTLWKNPGRQRFQLGSYHFRLFMIQVFGKGEWHNQICLGNQSEVAVLQTNSSEKSYEIWNKAWLRMMRKVWIRQDYWWQVRGGCHREEICATLIHYLLLSTLNTYGGCCAFIPGYFLWSWGSSLTVAEAMGTDEFTMETKEFSRMRRGFRRRHSGMLPFLPVSLNCLQSWASCWWKALPSNKAWSSNLGAYFILLFWVMLDSTIINFIFSKSCISCDLPQWFWFLEIYFW